jgi:hypothetical protein
MPAVTTADLEHGDRGTTRTRAWVSVRRRSASRKRLIFDPRSRN